MQKNWYIVYTKPKYEKKVAVLLTKKKIENFCPMNCTKIQSFRHCKIIQAPLFKSYVFVNITENETSLLKQLDGVLSLLYWMGKPAIINHEEIEAIKEFANDHQNIELQSMPVNTGDITRNVDGLSYSISGKVLALRNKIVKVNLPSLGYVMTAIMEEESIFGKEGTILQTIRSYMDNKNITLFPINQPIVDQVKGKGNYT